MKRGCVVIKVYGAASLFLRLEVWVYFRQLIFVDFPLSTNYIKIQIK